jgi:ubiquinone/menaquinone biosynthesis C-methylase UbiE
MAIQAERMQVSTAIEGIFSGMWNRSYRFFAWARYPDLSRRRVLKAALRRHRVAAESNVSVLDYGFGLGHGLFSFNRSAHLHGIELSPDAIQRATKKAQELGYAHFDFKKSPADDPLRIEYPSDTFDFVVCGEVLQHVYSDVRLVGELFRVLKPGGKCFVVTASDIHHHEVIAEESDRLNPEFGKSSINVRLYNPESFSYVVRQAGFRDLEAVTQDCLYGIRLQFPRPVQIALSVLFAAMPYGLWCWVDSYMQKRGHNPKRIMVVAKKPVPLQ